jgi:hypothetical protein
LVSLPRRTDERTAGRTDLTRRIRSARAPELAAIVVALIALPIVQHAH